MSKPIRVLVVDDSALMRKLIPQILAADSSIEVVGTAMDGSFGLRKIEELNPQVVTLDLEMPGMNGWEFRREQLSDPLLARIPVVVASGSNPGAIDADALLPKPYGTAELSEVLARLSFGAAAA